jgi:hypothetical protein
MTKNFFRFAVIGLLVTTFAVGCNKDDKEESLGGSNYYGTSNNEALKDQDFYADLLSYNVFFNDTDEEITGYAWEWEIQRMKGQTGLSHFNFIDGILCNTDEDAGTLRDHIIGAYYSQDGGSTWTNVPVTWATDNSTVKDGCNGGDVLKINFGGDNLQIRLVLDEEFEVGTQYAIFKRGAGGRGNSFDACGTIEFVGPGCPVDKDDCGEEETAWADGERYVSQGNWATYTAYDDLVNGVTIYAGQTIDVGTAKLVNGKIEINLTGGWELQSVSESVKIEGYTNAPSGNPQIGDFTYKGNVLSVTVGTYNYYGIHLDVQNRTDCED